MLPQGQDFPKLSRQCCRQNQTCEHHKLMIDSKHVSLRKRQQQKCNFEIRMVMKISQNFSSKAVPRLSHTCHCGIPQNQYFREKIRMNKENPFAFLKKNLYSAKFKGRKAVFCQILRVKNLYALIKSV